MRSFLPKLQASKSTFDSYYVVHCLHQFRNLSTEYDETKALLSVLIFKLQSSRKPCTSDQFTLIFEGMKRMSSSVPEVKQLLIAVMEQLRLNLQNIYFFPMQVNKD